MKTKLILAALAAIMVAGCTTPATRPKASENTGGAPVLTPVVGAKDFSIGPLVQAPAVPAPAILGTNKDIYVIYAPDGSSKITIDTTKATDMTDWAEHRLAPVLADWYPIMCAMMRTPGYTAPTNWTVTIAPGSGVAATGGTRVTANYTWFRTQMDKSGPFTKNEIATNIGTIVKRLKTQSDPASAYLWSQMSKEDQATLKATDVAQEAWVNAVLNTFNKFVDAPSMYDPGRFKGIHLTEETWCLLRQSPENARLSEVNRLLIQDVYANEISRRHLEGVGALVHEEVHVVQQYGSQRRTAVPGSFNIADITNLGSLAKKLRDQADPVSAYIYLEMTPGERRALAKYSGPGATAYGLRTNLVGALNRIAAGPALFDAALFKDVTLRDTTVTLRDGKPEGTELARLNRALLEDAYPGALARRGAAGGGRRGGGGGGGGANSGWLTEGIPDYIRWYLYQPEAHGADFPYFFAVSQRPRRGNPGGATNVDPNTSDPKYDGLYRPSAYFLNYVSTNYDSKIVTVLNDACRTGKYYEEIWSDYTGKTVQQLNEEWLDIYHKQRDAAKAAAATGSPGKT